MIRALPATAALVALAAALAGCSSDTKPAAAPPSSPPPPTASSSPTGSPTASPSPSVNPDTPLPLGKRRDRTADGYVTATVYGYRHNVAKSAPRPDEQPGYVWGAADVKVCANKDISASSVGVSHGPWVLVFADDTVAEPSSTGYESFPEPAYPWAEKRPRAGPVCAGGSPCAVAAASACGVRAGEVTPRWAVK
ncbi:hypothetical protein OOK41_31440 [Micromonospora sp. NBC_01655]|uniref:hypothetical protein n=1 Tax=Micromonospora sp. NBC_01655 TaxID=2975983 RepID=UPI002251C315|nr:hypothetical protein [Micromonospora sp. NBC_01655]MCX4474775.1 hypothetical protein [Micromonospora sp. NBC_01655]